MDVDAGDVGEGLARVGGLEHGVGELPGALTRLAAQQLTIADRGGNDTITQTVIDDTLPGGPREKTITYQAPWVRCDRERDYEIAWDHFARRFGLEGHS